MESIYHQNSTGNDSKRVAEALPQRAIWGESRKVVQKKDKRQVSVQAEGQEEIRRVVLARIKDIPAVLVLRVYPYVRKEVTRGREIM